MPVALLYPHFDHPALEERYASWQTDFLLRRGAAEHYHYDPQEPAADAAAEVQAQHVLVVTDPLLVASPELGERLLTELIETQAFAAVPLANESDHPKQKAAIGGYMTLREMQLVADQVWAGGTPAERVVWDQSDPAVFVCAKESLLKVKHPLRSVLAGHDVAISRRNLIHRWSSLRGQTRFDLLGRISTAAKSILEFGCGEGSLGEALKRRQKCRVVGIELDRHAAAIARKRLDDVYCGDVREIVSILHDKFDWIVGGDIVEHLDEPWSFLADLRHISAPAGRLLLSIPNVANASVINDLLHGRFDYVYMGLTCVGHLRFFTRTSIEEMLDIAGWDLVEIAPQEPPPSAGRDALIDALVAAKIPFSREDLFPAGYYVVAQNRS
jgi:2-polyprenyl-3-methyl-5-hydroxy-6-metoxy-1,4-benzoquinol methylase